MCDIFTSSMKDNGLATVVGSKTMGAGGNVTTHIASPVAGLILNQTESLLYNKAGAELENNGVEPDVALDTVEARDGKYSSVIAKALELASVTTNPGPNPPTQLFTAGKFKFKFN
jgi:C-terminal processing protease CtpA/Prc